MSLLSLTLILFFTIDPLGKISLFTDCVEKLPRPRRIIFREMLLALALMFLFSLIGEEAFTFLQISPITVRIVSGIILFLAAIKILFPSKEVDQQITLIDNQPLLVPLAIPGIASPALLAAIMLFSSLIDSALLMSLAIVIAWGISCLILVFAKPIKRFLGYNGLMAAERLMALILVMLAIQRFLDGITAFILQYR